MPKITTNENFDSNALLSRKDVSRAVIINELRHKATNYDDVIKTEITNEEYPEIVEEAKALVNKIILDSNCTKYEKYLFQLYLKRWNFFKKSDISIREEK